MPKTHYVAFPAGPQNRSITACGMEGWLTRVGSDEYDTAAHGAFDALLTWKGVTCKRCLRGQTQGPVKPESTQEAKT